MVPNPAFTVCKCQFVVKKIYFSYINQLAHSLILTAIGIKNTYFY